MTRLVSDASKRRMHEEAASNPSDVGIYSPEEVDSHIDDIGIHRRRFDRSVQIASPSGARRMLLYTERALTLLDIRAVVRGTTPSVKYFIKWAVDLSGLTVAAVNAGVTVTNTTTGASAGALDNTAIAAGSWVWIETSDESGTVDELAVTVILQEA
jgi:hypothetical protein